MLEYLMVVRDSLRKSRPALAAVGVLRVAA
jgi:hypothetical protein